jgi:hypothetical protein
MRDAFAVARFADKARYGRAILSQFLAEDLYGDGPMIGVLSAEDGGGSAFTHFAFERISGNRLTDEIFAWHAANLIPV